MSESRRAVLSSPTAIATEPPCCRRLLLVDEAATRALGVRLAQVLRQGDVVALEGDLGAGKSTVARACIQALAGAPIEVPSPTYTLIQTYSLPTLEVWHVDLYRLARGEEAAELGLEEAPPDVVLLIEWPDRLPVRPAGDRLTIRLHWDAASAGRLAEIEASPGWCARLDALTVNDRRPSLNR